MQTKSRLIRVCFFMLIYGKLCAKISIYNIEFGEVMSESNKDTQPSPVFLVTSFAVKQTILYGFLDS